MTRLTRKVRRVVPGERRHLVVTLWPGEGAEIEIREAYQRVGYRVTLRWLYAHLARRAAGLPEATGRRRHGK